MTPAVFRLLIQTVVSLALLASGIYILVTVDLILHRELSLLAAGWIGAVLAYWLR